jgi:hypothetical protein
MEAIAQAVCGSLQPSHFTLSLELYSSVAYQMKGDLNIQWLSGVLNEVPCAT